MTQTYLDYNATAPLRAEAKAAMIAALGVTGNPSSVHGFGRAARGVVEAAREQIAHELGAKPSQVIFTSGASEANAWVANGGWECIYHAGIEHDSIAAPSARSASDVVQIATEQSGVVNVGEIARHILQTNSAPQRTLVSVQMANNETGAVQPVAEIAEFAREQGVIMHTDAVQAVGRLPVSFHALGVNMMSVSAHKFGGPKGIGALLLDDDTNLPPLISGGGQERRRRAGTENVAAIAGFGAALEAAVGKLATVTELEQLRDKLEAGLKEISPQIVILAEDVARLKNTTCFALPTARAETILIKLDLAGIAVSSGAACSSGKVGASPTLKAMGIEDARARSAIRVSLGHETQNSDVTRFLHAWASICATEKIAA